jgi:hypothetical protein
MIIGFLGKLTYAQSNPLEFDLECGDHGSNCARGGPIQMMLS